MVQLKLDCKGEDEKFSRRFNALQRRDLQILIGMEWWMEEAGGATRSGKRG